MEVQKRGRESGPFKEQKGGKVLQRGERRGERGSDESEGLARTRACGALGSCLRVSAERQAEPEEGFEETPLALKNKQMNNSLAVV